MPARRSSPFHRLIVFVLLYFAGNILAAVCILLLAIASGTDLAGSIAEFETGALFEQEQMLRPMLIIQACALFILPALIFKRLYYPGRRHDYFDLARWPGLLLIVIAVAFLFASYPVVNLSYALNKALPLSGWMQNMEAQALQMMEAILNMQSPNAFLFNLLVIAVLPALGEELVFRGIVQKQLIRWFRNPVAGIWLAAIIFSAVHFQFEGFLPRIVLGLVLGYLYYWSRNLWIPILVHFLNNGVQVGVLYFAGIDMSALETESAIELTWWSVLLSFAVMFLLSEFMRSQIKQHA